MYLSYLPASHSYEHTVGLFFLPSIGTEIVYCRGVEHLAADMLTVRPTILTAVPRVLEVIRSRVLTQVARQARWQQALFHRAIEIGMKRADGRRLSFGDHLVDGLLDRLVRAKVRARFGGRLKAAMSGGARLEPEVGRFFLALGLMIMQGYGQTEAGPVISANPPDAIRIDTVGRVLEGVDLRLAEDGEILVHGDLVMDGYWGLPEATAAVIRDGWLHTGDIGALDDDGYLRITDRKKDMIVLSGGENVSPARVEGMLMAEPEISQAVVAGDGRSSLTALVVPAEGYDDVAAALAVTRVNHRLSVTERIRKHARGGAVHRGERAADADAEDPPDAGDTGEFRCVGDAARITRSHPQRPPVHIQQRLLLLHIRRLLPAHPDELPQHLHVEPGRLGLGIDVADVAAESLALLLQPLDAIDEAAQPVGGDAAGLGVRLLHRAQRHRSPPNRQGRRG